MKSSAPLPSPASEPTEALHYEQAIQRLEQIAAQIENGEAGIDDLAARLKEAQELIAFCRDRLTKAEAEVQKLLADE